MIRLANDGPKLIRGSGGRKPLSQDPGPSEYLRVFERVTTLDPRPQLWSPPMFGSR